MAKQMESELGSWLARVGTALFPPLALEKPSLSTTVSRPGSLSKRLGQCLHAGPPSRAVGGAVYHGETQPEPCRASSGRGPVGLALEWRPTGPFRAEDLLGQVRGGDLGCP